jgi:hypothetical protein
MIVHRPFEYYFARGLICLILGLAVRVTADEWSTVPPPSQSPPASTVLGTSSATTPAQPAPQTPPPDNSNNNQPPPQVAPESQPPPQQAPVTAPPPKQSANTSTNQVQQPTPKDDWADRDWKLKKITPGWDWTRHFRIGVLAGFNIKANMSMSGTFNISPTPGQYDDGYVLTDSRGAAGDSVVGTGNFGYDNASQVTSGGSQLLMHQATGFSANNASASGNDSPYIGFDLAYGDSYWYWEHAKIGWEFGFGFLPIDIRETVPVSVNQNTYTFNNMGGLSLSLLPSGYQGGYNAAGDGGAAVSSSPVSSSTGTIAGTTGEKLNVMLYTFRLGPTLYWNLCRPVGLYVGGGPAVGFVSGDLSSSGTLNLADGTSATYNASHASGTDLVYGGYLNATLVYHAVEGGDFYLGAEYMPLNSANFSGSGMSAHLDLSGQLYVTAGINWPF